MSLFQIFHRNRTPKEVIASAKNVRNSLVWVRKELPDAGAMQYAFETYGTPVYDFALGNGATFVRRPLRATSPGSWSGFAAPVLANPPLNTFQGQIATQPLMNPATAQSLGITQQGSIPDGAYNALPPMGPTLAP